MARQINFNWTSRGNLIKEMLGKVRREGQDGQDSATSEEAICNKPR